jgi:hypothetical protein
MMNIPVLILYAEIIGLISGGGGSDSFYCRLATTGNLAGYTYDNGDEGAGATLTAGSTGVLSVDGVAASVGDKILVKSQSAPAQNGIYTVTVNAGGVAAVLTRSINFDTASKILEGTEVTVLQGSTLAATQWIMNQTATIVVGTTAITFIELSISGALLAVNNLDDVANAATARENIGAAAEADLANYLELIGGTLTGSLAFNGTGLRLNADFSTATNSERFLFRSSTTNGNSYVGVIPNGTGNWSSYNVYSSSDPDNAHYAQFYADGAGNSVGINSKKNGTGTVRPIWFLFNDTPVIKINDATNITIPNTMLANGSQIKTGLVAGNDYSLGAQTAAGIYKQFITFTCDGPIAGVPQCIIDQPAGTILSINNSTEINTVDLLASGKVQTVLLENPAPSDTLFIQDGNGPIDLNGAEIDISGRMTNTNQPAFLARNSTNRLNVTGDGTNYLLIFNTVIKNQGGLFDGVSTATAPVAGLYSVNGAITLYGLNVSYTIGTVYIVTSNRNYEFTLNPGTAADTGGNFTFFFPAGLIELDAADTVQIYVGVNGGTPTVNVVGAEILTFFNMALVC